MKKECFKDLNKPVFESFSSMCESYNLFLKLCNAFRNKWIKLCTETIKTKKMNTTEAKGNWNEQKGKLKQKFAMLTDNDLMFLDGKKDEMLGRLQIKLGKTKEQLLDIIAAL